MEEEKVINFLIKGYKDLETLFRESAGGLLIPVMVAIPTQNTMKRRSFESTQIIISLLIRKYVPLKNDTKM